MSIVIFLRVPNYKANFFRNLWFVDGSSLENRARPPVECENVEKNPCRLTSANEAICVVVCVEHHKRGRSQKTYKP